MAPLLDRLVPPPPPPPPPRLPLLLPLLLLPLVLLLATRLAVPASPVPGGGGGEEEEQQEQPPRDDNLMIGPNGKSVAAGHLWLGLPHPRGPQQQGCISTTRGTGGTFVSEYFSQSLQKLSPYRWYGNARLFRFRVPEDTVLLRWLLEVSCPNNSKCENTRVTVHIRYGAPPIINPLGKAFPANASVHLSYNQTLALAGSQKNTTLVNLTCPAAGDWFLAAHLPESTGKIEIQGVSRPYTYIFQADLFVLRVVDIPILEPNVPLAQTMAWPRRQLHAKMFVPGYTATLHFHLMGCTGNASSTCLVQVTLGSATLSPTFSQKKLNCTGSCSLLLTSPPWETWLLVTVESLHGARASLTLEMTASFTACKPGGPGSFQSFFWIFNRGLKTRINASTAPLATTRVQEASGQEISCLHSQPVIREDLDVVSVRFRILGDANVPVRAKRPTLLLLNLRSGADSGGTLVLNLTLNQTSRGLGNATLWACLNAASPVISLNTTEGCRTAFREGHALLLSTSSPEASLVIPFPEVMDWFLSLHLFCPKAQPGDCDKAEAHLAVQAFLSPCFKDCGNYGQCSLMRRHGYIYAGCNCKAGWDGWACTDGSKGQSLGAQTLATLLLTLSNLFLLPAIAVALYRYYLVEASVYTITMFFSTFYHACDQPGVVVFCIMEYDTMQYCDFLSSVVSFWVTILCMARIKNILKYVLCVVGTLFIAMVIHLDRRGVWNLMGPCLIALVLMMVAWASRCVTRRHCYPPSWKRWAFFLLPGIGLAGLAVVVYACMETTENYYYTHSLWHILVALSLVFLLPPGDELQQEQPWAWPSKLFCRYHTVT